MDRALVLLFLSFLAGGCEPRADTGGFESVVVRDSAGIEIIETGPGWRDHTPRWSLDSLPEVVIPSESPTEEYFLFQVGDVRRLEDGRWAVENRGSREVYFFEPDGQFEDRSGGIGEGPDEFHRATQRLDVCDDGRLLVREVRTAVTLEPDGSVSERRDLPVDAWMSGAYAVPAGANDECSRIFLNRWHGEWAPEDQARPVFKETQLLWVELESGRIDTIAVRPGTQGLRTTDGHVMDVLAYPLRASWVVRDDSVYWGLGDHAEYALLDPDADIVRIVRWHASPESITRSDWLAWDQDRDAYSKLSPVDLFTASDQSDWTVKPFYGAIRSPGRLDPAFRLDDEGNLWVREFKRESLSRWVNFELGTERPAQDWIVFSTSGRILATVRTPPTFWVHGIHGGYVFGVARDEFAAEEIRAYRLRTGSEGS